MKTDAMEKERERLRNAGRAELVDTFLGIEADDVLDEMLRGYLLDDTCGWGDEALRRRVMPK